MGAVLLDGYEVATGYTLATGVTVANSSTIGVTQGANSLQVVTPGGWLNAVQSNGGSILAGIKSTYDTYGSAAIKIDLTAPDAAAAGWWQLNLAFQGQGLGWTQTPTNVVTTAGPIATETVTWDVTSIMAANDANIPANPNWGQFVVLTNTGAAGRTFYIDNLRVEAVPEPTILAGVAISSLGLMIRKRQK